MKRILLIAAAAAVALAPLAAEAQGRGEGRGNGRWRGEGPRSGRAERAERYDRYEDRGGRYDPRPDYRRRYDSRNEPPPYAVAPRGGGRGWGRGDYLPPMYRNGVVRDRERYRLRTPPPGYDWVGVGPDIYLMQRGTGLILDTIPGGF